MPLPFFMSRTNLIHLKAKRILKYLRAKYRRPRDELSEAAGCGYSFLRNFVFVLTPGKRGTIVPKLGRLCKYYGIDIRYLADDETPLEAPFLDRDGYHEPSLFDLSLHLSRRDSPEIFGAMVGWSSAYLHALVNRGDHYAVTFPEPGRATLSLRAGGQHSELEFKKGEDRTVWVQTTYFHGKPSNTTPSLLTVHYLGAWAKQLNRKLKN